MAHRLSYLISQGIAHLPHIPRIVGSVRESGRFLREYAKVSDYGGQIYTLRDSSGSIRIQTRNQEDASTIANVFIKGEYGPIPSPSVVVDIGANIGVFCLYASRFGPDVRVLAYEPITENYDYLEKNLTLNGIAGQCCPFRQAVAATAGPRTLYLSSHVSHSLHPVMDSGSSVTIDCTTLADILAENNLEQIDLLKMDCEGAEYEILYNAAPETLAKIRRIRLEYHNLPDPRGNGTDLTQHLLDCGYRIEHQRTINEWCGIVWATREQ